MDGAVSNKTCNGTTSIHTQFAFYFFVKSVFYIIPIQIVKPKIVVSS